MGLPFNITLAVPFVIGLLMLLRARPIEEPQVAGILSSYHQRASRWRTGGLTAGLASAALVAYGGLPPGQDHWLAGLICGVCILGGVLTGELLVSRPDGHLRAATLMPRRIRDYLPRRYGPLLGLLVLILTALMTITITAAIHMASPNRPLSVTCPNGTLLLPQGSVLSAALSALASLIGGAGMCLLVLRKIVTRPAFPSDADPDKDNALRARSAEAVTLAWGCQVASSVLASSMLVTTYFDTAADAPCNAQGLMPSRVVAYLLVAGSAAALVYFLTRLTRLPRQRKAAA
ncbi:hypothetical protein ACFWC5_05905 [Streptomyces sp. NPDC060085]|uniref:hypothetical protein n=1 Tax=Streptomyces sp. NPDC060085 TaxID=3347054 RepID=UPI00364F740D